MEQQGFDPMDHTAKEVVAFMEQLESAKSHDKVATKVKAKKPDRSFSKKKSRNGSSKKETKYCKIHGHYTHLTEECRSKNKRHKSDSKNGNRGHNKTWKRNADEETLVSKKELAVLIKKAVKKEVSTKENKRNASPVMTRKVSLSNAWASHWMASTILF
jgi:hypothetical protein